MRRLAGIAALVAAVGTIAVLGSGAGEQEAGYVVRAEFRNAFSLVEGEDVRVAGVRVGSIAALDLDMRRQIALVDLRIDDPGFRDFRADATCSIRPQSLIGEKYVDCTLTEPRAPGAAAPPALRRLGSGQRLLPVSRTHRPVDLDLVNNVLRLPERERLSLILNELGTGLAARGEDLNAAVRAANPALRETDRVLAILADQNDALEDLARDGDRVLAPLARERDAAGRFVVHARDVARATAERRADLEAGLRRLPAFLRELSPTMRRLGALSDRMSPVLEDVGAVAPEVTRLVRGLGPFSQAGTPALVSLGDTADTAREALVDSRPLVADLGRFGTQARPLLRDVAALTSSLRDTGGIPRLMDFLLNTVTSINGYDRLGHYLRAFLLVNLCSTYTTQGDASCTANFRAPEAASARAASTVKRTPALKRSDQALMDYLLGDRG